MYFTLFPAGGETADAIKAQTQGYMESVEAQGEFNERYESLPLGVMCPDEFYGAYIDTQAGMVE